MQKAFVASSQNHFHLHQMYNENGYPVTITPEINNCESKHIITCPSTKI